MFDKLLADALSGVLNESDKSHDKKYVSAVAIIQDRDKWLLGLAKNSGDDREGKWVHSGGHIKRGETPEEAAVREAFEETGIRVKAVGKAFDMPGHKNVAFVHCKVTSSKQKFKNNHEFSVLGFFKFTELKSLKLFKNTKELIQKVK